MLKNFQSKPILGHLRVKHALAGGVFTGSVFWLGTLWTAAPGALTFPLFNVTTALLLSTVSLVAISGFFAQALTRLNQENRSLRVLHQCELDSHKHALSGFSAVCVLDAQNRIIEANDEFTTNVATTNPLDSMPLEDALPGISESAFWQALKKHEFWTGDVKLDRGEEDPRDYLVTAFPQLAADGTFMRTLVVMFDRTEEKVGVLDDMLHATLEYLNEDVYVYEVDTLQLRYMNRNARLRCNWSEDQVRKKRVTDTFPGYDFSIFRKHTAPIVSAEKASATVHVRKGELTVEIVTRLITGPDNRRLFVSTVRELSDRQEIENARMQSVSMISHELRTPLTSIKGALSLLTSGALGHIPSQADQILKIADRNSDRLLNVINDILDYEKLASGNMNFSDTEVDLKALITEALENMKGYAAVTEVTLEPDLPETEAVVFGDGDRLMQVLVNLISNAAKFSPLRSQVTISLRRSDQGWRIAVTDRGPGIPEDMLPQIGKPFTQFEATRDKKHLGTGLGLTIVKKILAHHRSNLIVTSKEGEGSEFAFDLQDFADASGTKGGNLIAFKSENGGKRYGT